MYATDSQYMKLHIFKKDLYEVNLTNLHIE